MKNLEVSRRRFLAFCGGGIAGIWFAGTGLVRLPAQMVFAMSGSCSFCGKEAREVFGLAGITHRNVRVCDECIDLCFEIIAEEAGLAPPVPAPAESVFDRFKEASKAAEQDAEQLMTRLGYSLDELRPPVAAGEQGDPWIDALARAVIRANELVVPPQYRPRTEDLICSFCDKDQRDVVKLIAGPTVYICDGCIGDAGALFMRYGWRPGTRAYGYVSMRCASSTTSRKGA